MYSHRASFKYSHPQVKILDGAKTGLAMISMVANDYTHKPIKKKVTERWFAHLARPEGKSHGYSKWPSWRIPAVLYQWKVPYDVAAWYMVQDMWVPLSFLFMLVQRRLQLHDGRLWTVLTYFERGLSTRVSRASSPREPLPLVQRHLSHQLRGRLLHVPAQLLGFRRRMRIVLDG